MDLHTFEQMRLKVNMAEKILRLENYLQKILSNIEHLRAFELYFNGGRPEQFISEKDIVTAVKEFLKEFITKEIERLQEEFKRL